MKVETLIYSYIAICVSLILFNCVYVLILRRSEKKLSRKSNYYGKRISLQLELLDDGEKVSESHKKLLRRKLKRTANLTAFDRSIDVLYKKDAKKTANYLVEIHSVFVHISAKYQGNDTIKAAYFPYIISKYNILLHKKGAVLLDLLFDLLRSDNVYCRENALKAIYSTGLCEYAVKALRLVDENPSFHHPKLIHDGLMDFKGNRNELGHALLEAFDTYSVKMQQNILDFVRFAGIRRDDTMYEILTDKERNQELRFSAIRYFEKYPQETVRAYIQDIAENKERLPWEYQSIASSALKSYPDERTAQILKKNLSHSNWYVRLNSAMSCERLGLTYADLAQIFDGEDRYAREMIKYRLDRQKAQQGVARS